MYVWCLMLKPGSIPLLSLPIFRLEEMRFSVQTPFHSCACFTPAFFCIGSTSAKKCPCLMEHTLCNFAEARENWFTDKILTLQATWIGPPPPPFLNSSAAWNKAHVAIDTFGAAHHCVSLYLETTSFLWWHTCWDGQG